MENNNETFSFTYSAKEQSEVQNIRKKYLPKEEDKMERLRQLDRSVTQKGTVASLVIGISGALLLGVGMCCCMIWDMLLLGIPVGIIGMICAAAAYPVYNRVIKKEREKIAPEVLRLTDELMK